MTKHKKVYAGMSEKEKAERMDRLFKRTIRIAKRRQNKAETGNTKPPPTL